ncbi:oligogalacturonide transporter [Bifidobacterium breve]|nr:oligogalacturonide transporter [Bifidobacterium breve]
MHEVERLRAGGDKADVDSSVRRTVERLTGLPYEECWK